MNLDYCKCKLMTRHESLNRLKSDFRMPVVPICQGHVIQISWFQFFLKIQWTIFSFCRVNTFMNSVNRMSWDSWEAKMLFYIIFVRNENRTFRSWTWMEITWESFGLVSHHPQNKKLDATRKQFTHVIRLIKTDQAKFWQDYDYNYISI